MSDRGSGTIIAVGLAAAIAALTATVLPLYSALTVKQSVAAAADAAALAAADAIVGRTAGFPCEVAARVAAANGTSVTACDLDGLIATVTVARSLAGFPVGATATAGPG
ncbi:MAG: Rv3654c family TadE-like protein [Rhodoglobus sp.]